MIKAIVIGTSYGGLQALRTVIQGFPKQFKIPVIIVLHIGNNDIHSFITMLNKSSAHKVKEAEEKEIIKNKTIYFAPPNYHLQVEDGNFLSLSTAEKVNYSRPAIDVLFETAAWAYKHELLGVLLTGSNSDGAKGLKTIKDCGGLTIVENPVTALAPKMPQSALDLFEADYILDIDLIANKIVEICT